MPASTTLTIRVPVDLKERLGRLATLTQRSPSFLAGEAIASFLAREAAIIEGIEQGLGDMKAGRIVEHEDAMRRVNDSIDEVESGGR
jgi:predicted transcriptional regulator